MTYDPDNNSRKSCDVAVDASSRHCAEQKAARRGPLTAPFTWFGGKSSIAAEIWLRLGDVRNYVEPFFGSGAVMLARPHAPKTETINDLDQFVSNFWRAVKADPNAVANAADWPVNETDLQARHYWLVTQGRKRLSQINGDPDAYDAKVAGWWLWGTCNWIGSGFCSGKGPWQWGPAGWDVISDAGQGINRQLPHLGDAGQGINRQLPHLGNAGRGINRQRPHLGDAGRGINRKLPHLGDAGQGINRKQFIMDWCQALSDRLRDVRVCAGDWSRVCGPSVTWGHGLTGIFLDPPYADTASRTDKLYATDDLQVAHAVRRWAIENGNNPLLRICLAGYDGEHEMPSQWDIVEWKARGGLGNQGDETSIGRCNSRRERLWFSPHCVKPHRDLSLIDLMEQ